MVEEESSVVTYKKLKEGSGTWKTWQTVYEIKRQLSFIDKTQLGQQ